MVWKEATAGETPTLQSRTTLHLQGLFLADYDFLSLKSLQAKIKTYPMLCDQGYCISAEEKRHFEPFQPIALP